MNRFKLQAYMKEFPFLRNIIGDAIPDSVRIKRTDENLLRFVPRYSRHDGSKGQTVADEKVHFVLADGTIIEDAVQQSGDISSNYAYSQPRSWEGEAVLEAIDRHGIADKLQYIVIEYYYLDDWVGDEYVEKYTFTVYKPPKDTSFGAEIEKAMACALAEVRAEANF